MKILKKIFILLAIFLVLVNTNVPFIAYADDATPSVSTTTPTPTDTPSVTPIDTPTNTPSPTQNPTQNTAPLNATPTDTPASNAANTTPTPDITVTATNSADVTNSTTSSADTGTNTITVASDSASATGDATVSPNPSVSNDPSVSQNPNANTINTGNSTSTTDVQNVVNTTSVNSQIVYQTINIFVNSDQTIDLSAPITVATNVASASNAADSADVVMNNTNNYAVVNNAIVSAADSGNNTGSGSGQFVVNTGNAYSLVNLLNTVNVTLTNSVIHMITINIYGTLNGNIVLPQLGGNTTCTSCSITLSTQNSAAVTNTVNSQAVTGQNTLTATTGDNSIVTGDAQNATDITNLINLILLNEMTGHLYINDLGEWDGQFLGWDGSTATQLGNTLALDNTPTITGSNNQSSQENINNSANVNNNIQSSANTGGNTINGSNGRITTGSAYNAVAITNLINAIFSHSYGFFGFVNIFGTLHGNIGGQTSLLHLPQHQLLLPKLLLRPTP